MPSDSRIALFHRLFGEHVALVAWILNHHLRKVGLADEVQDHVREVFLKGFKSFRIEDAVKFTPWLSRMTKNHAIDQLRKHASRAKTFSDEDVRPLMRFIPSKSASPEEVLIDDETCTLRHDRLKTACALLPDPQREALHLHFFEGLNEAEIARRLDIPRNTVKSRIRYALDKLRRYLEEAETHTDLSSSRLHVA